jgi:hypothetical protein
LSRERPAIQRFRWKQAVERNRVGEFRAKLVARRPFNNGIGPVAIGQDQPNARPDLEMGIGLRHKPALGDIEHARLDTAGAELAHLGVEIDRKARRAAPVTRVGSLGDTGLDHRMTYLHEPLLIRAANISPILPSLAQQTRPQIWPRPTGCMLIVSPMCGIKKKIAITPRPAPEDGRLSQSRKDWFLSMKLVADCGFRSLASTIQPVYCAGRAKETAFEDADERGLL